MKTKLLLTTVFFTASFLFTNAQCVRSGSFIQSDPAYSISGTGNITFETNGDKNVVFEGDFATVQGADLRVYLSKTDDIATAGSGAIEVTTSQLINDDGGTGGPGVSPITGMMGFPIPAAVNLDDFDYIVIQCIAINERWGHVILGANTGVDCAVLNVAENILNKQINLYPNPASNTLYINNDSSKIIEVKIHSILGNLIFDKTLTNKTDFIDISELNNGAYFVTFTTGKTKVTKKIIKL